MNKTKKIKKIPGLLLLFFSLISIIIIVLYFIKAKNVDRIEIDFTAKSKDFGVYKDKFYYSDEDKFYLYDLNGEKKLEKKLSKDSTYTFYNEDIYNVNKNGLLTVFDKKQGSEKKKINLNKQVNKIVKDKKEILIYHDKGIEVRDDKLNIIKEISSKYPPVDYVSNNSLQTIISLGYENERMISSLVILEKDKEIYRLESIDELFLKAYIKDHQIIVFTNRYIYSIARNTIINKTPLLDLKDIYIQDDRIYYIDYDELKTIDFSGKLINVQEIKRNLEKVYHINNQLVLVGNNELVIYREDKIEEIEIEGLIDSISNQNKLYLIFENRLEIYG